MLTPSLRELIIDRAMAVEDERVELDKLKVIVLMVLWTRRGTSDADPRRAAARGRPAAHSLTPP